MYFSDDLFNQFRESTYMQVRMVTDDGLSLELLLTSLELKLS